MVFFHLIISYLQSNKAFLLNLNQGLKDPTSLINLKINKSHFIILYYIILYYIILHYIIYIILYYIILYYILLYYIIYIIL